MNNGSRKKNVMRNMFVGTFFQILSLLIGFVNRTFFIKLLGEEYLGVNTLFTNILTILSFAELGIGNAIIFNLYKPLANDDKKQVGLLLKFYRNTYYLIGAVMLISGLILTFFIPNLIENVPNIHESIYVIYILFLLDTVVSYFFSYRVAIIQADQKNYIVVKTIQCCKIIQIIIQIIVLYLTHNYYLYVILQLTCTIITYSYLSYKSKKMYEYTLEMPKEELPREEKLSIFSNVKALFVYKVGSVVLNGTDSIIISKYLGLAILGLYSNYLLIVNAFTQILSQVFNAFTASVGNLIAVDNKGRSKEIFDQLYYFTAFIYCIISVCLYLLFNDFINIWLGEKYLLSDLTVFAIVLHFYINGTQFAAFTYRQTSGLFMQYRFSPVIASVTNIVLSIVFAKSIGLAGVFFATSISRIISAGWIDPLIVYKNVFKENVIPFYGKYIFDVIKTIIIGYICFIISKNIIVVDMWTFILKGLVIGCMTVLLFLLTSCYKKEFKQLKDYGLTLIKRKGSAK